ncbi:MAG: AAA family ATPase [Bacilli bacterium]|nr:AAA family ATPase [Bacilli bacterium]
MAKINGIVINGFKAFPSLHTIELEGKHLLMYGENGSGKSSIYYALHCIFNSYRKPDKGKKYFDKSNSQNLVNRFFSQKNALDKPHVAINWSDRDGGLFSSKVFEEGCEELKELAELETFFVNHQLLNGFFNFTNSNSINLFPIFQREILPYKYTNKQSLSIMYEQIVNEALKLGNNSPTKQIKEMIDSFNSELDSFIGDINISVSDIYKNYFKTEGDQDLSILLTYPEENPNPDVFFDGFRLKWDNRLIRNQRGELERTINKSLIEPIIGIIIKENGNEILKPHVYFNEAKLTAIALSIRFALLKGINPADDSTPPEGSFLALDDMLISLDMSNRTKVVDFLLKISDKYKIYLFTHDKAFFNYVCHEIHQSGKTEDWVYKRVSYNANNKEPIVLDEHSDYLSKAKYFYEIGDYDTSAINIRKQLEQSVGELLPYELKVDTKGRFISLEKLWDKFVTFYSNNGKPLDPVMQNLFSDSKLLILNVAAHYQRLSNPIYKIELDKAFKLVDYVRSLEKISNKLVIEGGKRIVFQHPTIDYKCSFELDSDLEIVQDEHIVARIPKCKNIRWSYNGVDNWDFETNQQDSNHPLLTSCPKITNFFKNCCDKLPLGITEEMLMKHCKISGVSINDYLGGARISALIIEAIKA